MIRQWSNLRRAIIQVFSKIILWSQLYYYFFKEPRLSHVEKRENLLCIPWAISIKSNECPLISYCEVNNKSAKMMSQDGFKCCEIKYIPNKAKNYTIRLFGRHKDIRGDVFFRSQRNDKISLNWLKYTTKSIIFKRFFFNYEALFDDDVTITAYAVKFTVESSLERIQKAHGIDFEEALIEIKKVIINNLINLKKWVKSFCFFF